MIRMRTRLFKRIKKREIEWTRASGDKLMADAMERYNNEGLQDAEKIKKQWALVEEKKREKVYKYNDLFCVLKYDRKGELKTIVEYYLL